MTRKLWIGGVALTLVMVLGLLTIAFARTTALPVAAQVSPVPATGVVDAGTVSVEGTGIIYVKPDVVRFTVGLETKAGAVRDAQKQSADQSKNIADALKKAGIKAEDILTVGYSVRPDYIYEANKAPKLNGYVVDNRLQVTVRDTSKVGDVIDAVSVAGANQIDGISFTLDNNAEALKQARIAAMNDARVKADQLGTAGKVTVGTVVKVSEQSQNLAPQPALMQAKLGNAGTMDSAPSTVIESGQFQVRVDVQVTYSINR